MLKAKLLEAMYENELKFPGGREDAKQKTFHGEKDAYFLELHNPYQGGDIKRVGDFKYLGSRITDLQIRTSKHGKH